MNKFKIKLDNNENTYLVDIPENVLSCTVRQVWYPPIKNCNTCISIFTNDVNSTDALSLLSNIIKYIKINKCDKITLLKLDKVVGTYNIFYSSVQLISTRYFGVYLYIKNEASKK